MANDCKVGWTSGVSAASGFLCTSWVVAAMLRSSLFLSEANPDGPGASPRPALLVRGLHPSRKGGRTGIGPTQCRCSRTAPADGGFGLRSR